MSEQNDDFNTEDDQDASPKGLREALKAAQARVKELEPQAHELVSLKREVTFRDVGLDPNKPQHQDFMKAYAGDLTEAAIREAAQARGYLDPPLPASETMANDRINSASTGAEPAVGNDLTSAMQAIANAKSPSEISQLAQHYGVYDVHQ